MPNLHTLVPVGMIGVQTHRDDLEHDLEKIFEGDTSLQIPLSEACNAVHVYQNLDQVTQQPPPAEKWRRALDQYTNLTTLASQQSNGRLKCLIGDLTQKGGEFWFYDASMTPDTVAVDNFVQNFIDYVMNNNNLINNVLGWYLADEPHDTDGSSTKPSLGEFTDICQTAHDAQTAKGWNKPFYVSFYMDGSWTANHQSIDFDQWIDPWVNAVTSQVGANLVIMIDFYPWAIGSPALKFRQYPASEASRSYLRRWWKFIHDTNEQYRNNTKVIGIEVILQAFATNPSRLDIIPSHADMHQQVCAVRNFMQEPSFKPGGVWLYAWGRGEGITSPTNLAMACHRWTQPNTERYAEAVQNEIDNQTEGIVEAIPVSNTVLEAIPDSFQPYNGSKGGCWITFQLKDRGRAEFTIKDSDGIEKRRLSWECDYNSVQQKAINAVDNPPGQVDKLGSTAIFFDGRDDCGNDLQGNYTCQMLLDGSPVGSTLNLTVQLVINPGELPIIDHEFANGITITIPEGAIADNDLPVILRCETVAENLPNENFVGQGLPEPLGGITEAVLVAEFSFLNPETESPVDVTLNEEVTVCYPYNPAYLQPETPEESLRLYKLEDEKWKFRVGSYVDTGLM